MWVYYNPNPTGRNVEDCAVRAMSKALHTDWERAFALIAADAFQMGDMMHSNAVWGATLRKHGFYRAALPNTCPDCYTAEDFATDHPRGVYVLGFGRHVATIDDGNIYDTWDSSQEIPQYYWYKKEEENGL